MAVFCDLDEGIGALVTHGVGARSVRRQPRFAQRVQQLLQLPEAGRVESPCQGRSVSSRSSARTTSTRACASATSSRIERGSSSWAWPWPATSSNDTSSCQSPRVERSGTGFEASDRVAAGGAGRSVVPRTPRGLLEQSLSPRGGFRTVIGPPCTEEFDMRRRTRFLVTCALALIGVPSLAQTSARAPDAYPNKPIRLVVPFAAGTGARCAGPADRPGADRVDVGQRRGGERARRGRHHRRRPGRQVGARRLHAAALGRRGTGAHRRRLRRQAASATSRWPCRSSRTARCAGWR